MECNEFRPKDAQALSTLLENIQKFRDEWDRKGARIRGGARQGGEAYKPKSIFR